MKKWYILYYGVLGLLTAISHHTKTVCELFATVRIETKPHNYGWYSYFTVVVVLYKFQLHAHNQNLTQDSPPVWTQETYRPPCSKFFGGGFLPWPGGTYLGWGIPTLARGTYLSWGYLPWVGGYLPWPVGYLPWLGGTYLGWGAPTLARGVPTLAGRHLPWPGVTYLGWRVPTLARGYLHWLGWGTPPDVNRRLWKQYLPPFFGCGR